MIRPKIVRQFLLLAFCILFPSTGFGDIYTYQGKNGELLVTTEPRKDLKLIDVIKDSSKKKKKKRTKAKVPKNKSYSRPESAYDELIKEASEAYELPFSFIKAVIKVESAFNPYAVSRVGAMGLMQLMPATAEELGVKDPFDPRDNVFGGVKLLRILTNRYNGDINLILAAYNAGSGAVAKYQGIPYSGTRKYIIKIYRHYQKYKKLEEDRMAEEDLYLDE